MFSEEQYRTVIEIIEEGIVVVDTDENFLFANPAADKIFGLSRGKLVGKNISEFVSEVTFGFIKRQTELRNPGKSDNFDIEIIKPDGEKGHILITSTPKYENGKFIASFSVFRDISELKRADEKIKESERRLRKVHELSRTAGYFIDYESQEVIWTDEIFGIMEREPGDIPDHLHELKNRLIASDQQKLQELLEDFYPSQTQPHAEYKYITPSGKIKYLLTEASIEYDENGNPIQIYGFLQDITERKLIEEKLEKYAAELKDIDSMKDKLFSIISHDLRNPIGNMMSLLDMVTDKNVKIPQEKKDQYIEILKDSSKQIYELLENLLNWARSEINILAFKPQIQEINGLVNETIRFLLSSAIKKDINLFSDITEPIYAYFDVNLIKTVLRNLISNAIKFTGNGGEIKISASVINEFVEIIVSDNGMGISKENINKIFQKGMNFTTRGTGGEKGTGLGLSICKEFVEKNGGKIWIESEYKRGSNFKFSVPQYPE